MSQPAPSPRRQRRPCCLSLRIIVQLGLQFLRNGNAFLISDVEPDFHHIADAQACGFEQFWRHDHVPSLLRRDHRSVERQFAKFTLDPQARKAVEWQLGSKVVGHEDDGVGIGLVVQMSDVRFEYV